MRAQLARERLLFVVELFLEVRITVRKLRKLEQVACATFETVPGRDEIPALRGLSGQLAGCTWVVPRARLRQLGVELVGPFALARQVKGAPSARGSGSTAISE